MKILVTGAAGFLGSYVSNHLLDHQIHAATRQQLDLTDLTAVTSVLKHNRYDVVINCAAAGREQLRSYEHAIYANNLESFYNLAINDQYYSKLINIGSGAEFDIDQDIDQMHEFEIWNRRPQYSYGQSKNIISRFSVDFPKTTTLRLFGCFDPSESPNRLLKRFIAAAGNELPFILEQDRYFDMVSARDFVRVIEAVIDGTIQDQDLNVVYDQKYRLSDILMLYSKLHGIDTIFLHVQSSNILNYTGNSDRLARYNLNLDNLEKSLLLYGK
jgi:nucleoside-diphosphate-sugar epimerase